MAATRRSGGGRAPPKGRPHYPHTHDTYVAALADKAPYIHIHVRVPSHSSLRNGSDGREFMTD